MLKQLNDILRRQDSILLICDIYYIDENKGEWNRL